MAKVLVVERDDAVREARRFVLADAGHDVMEAVDGQLAVRLLRAARQSVIALFDMLALDPAGRDALAELAANERVARRHAYAILAPGSQLISPALWPILTTLKAHIVQRPVSDDVLLHTVALAAAEVQVQRLPLTRRVTATDSVKLSENPPSKGMPTQHNVALPPDPAPFMHAL